MQMQSIIIQYDILIVEHGSDILEVEDECIIVNL